MEKINVWHLPISVGTQSELKKAAVFLLKTGGKIYTVNPKMMMISRKNEVYMQVLRQGDLLFPDGNGILLAMPKKRHKTDIICGVELGEFLAKQVLSIAIIGAKKGVAQKAFLHLKEANSSLHLSFAFDGYAFTERQVKESLQKTKPNLVFVCLGMPKQEELIEKIYKASPGSVFIGLGGSLDVYAGQTKRAPLWMRRIKCEWLYRMLTEPKRIRDFPTLWHYFWLCWDAKIKFSKQRTDFL